MSGFRRALGLHSYCTCVRQWCMITQLYDHPIIWSPSYMITHLHDHPIIWFFKYMITQLHDHLMKSSVRRNVSFFFYCYSVFTCTHASSHPIQAAFTEIRRISNIQPSCPVSYFLTTIASIKTVVTFVVVLGSEYVVQISHCHWYAEWPWERCSN